MFTSNRWHLNLDQVRCIMAEVDELNRQIQIREMRREKLEVDLD